METLTKKQFDILALLAEENQPLTQRQLKERLDVSLGTVNRTVKELTESGLIDNGVITRKGQDALEPYRVRERSLSQPASVPGSYR